jgi:hypothetical protein
MAEAGIRKDVNSIIDESQKEGSRRISAGAISLLSVTGLMDFCFVPFILPSRMEIGTYTWNSLTANIILWEARSSEQCQFKDHMPS